MNIKIAQFGLGPIGIETLKLAATKPWAEIVGGIDIDPVKVGKNLAEITDFAPLEHARVYRSLTDLLAKSKPDVIFHTAVSNLKAAVAQIEPGAARSGTRPAPGRRLQSRWRARARDGRQSWFHHGRRAHLPDRRLP
jgi:hypothetical protein